MDTNQIACRNQIILDGPYEVIHGKLEQFQKANRESLLLAEKKSLERKIKEDKNAHARAFIRRYTKISDITTEQMKNLVSELEDREIKLLESQVLVMFQYLCNT